MSSAAAAAGGAPSMVSMNSDSRLRSICRIVALRCWIDRPDGVGEGGEDVWASCWRRRLLFGAAGCQWSSLVKRRNGKCRRRRRRTIGKYREIGGPNWYHPSAEIMFGQRELELTLGRERWAA